MITHAACDVPTGRPLAVTSAVKVIVPPGEMPSGGRCIEVVVWTTVKVVVWLASLTAALPLTTLKSRTAAAAAAAPRTLRRMAPPVGWSVVISSVVADFSGSPRGAGGVRGGGGGRGR